MQEWGASREETAFLEGVAGYPWEGEGTEVSAAKHRHKKTQQSISRLYRVRLGI